ncbi:3-hydroxyacyl-CoA dehydrogenase NAD-binding domain-containing protein [Mesorhizobium sp.]|uniref:3-hydroxyacyl-CoA dehydrogenase NAD-binding domain-containing protein n=1 Tax=Mesorhizobium sp. TaxID=1871066 RepID=UPI000FE908DD|nr:MAG: hypothetical protein EOR07_31725 [Mesorhizobium sp.]
MGSGAGLAGSSIGSLDCYEPQLRELQMPTVRSRLRLCASLGEAVAEAELVQENAPERIDLKRALVREIASLAPLDSIIASSTSGLLPADIAKDLSDPGRLLVAHPFFPPHLVRPWRSSAHLKCRLKDLKLRSNSIAASANNRL